MTQVGAEFEISDDKQLVRSIRSSNSALVNEAIRELLLGRRNLSRIIRSKCRYAVANVANFYDNEELESEVWTTVFLDPAETIKEFDDSRSSLMTYLLNAIDWAIKTAIARRRKPISELSGFSSLPDTSSQLESHDSIGDQKDGIENETERTSIQLVHLIDGLPKVQRLYYVVKHLRWKEIPNELQQEILSRLNCDSHNAEQKLNLAWKETENDWHNKDANLKSGVSGNVKVEVELVRANSHLRQAINQRNFYLEKALSEGSTNAVLTKIEQLVREKVSKSEKITQNILETLLSSQGRSKHEIKFASECLRIEKRKAQIDGSQERKGLKAKFEEARDLLTLTPHRIAKFFGKSESSIASELSRAKSYLKTKLNQQVSLN